MSKSSRNKNTIIPQEIIGNFQKEQKKIVALKEWKRFISSNKSLYNKAISAALPFDWRFNAVHWAFDVVKLCEETAYSLCWMNAYADFYRSKIKSGTQPSHTDFHVSYFADNCIIGIDSCRDKIALMVWAYYCPFNPEKLKEVLVYEDVVERLKAPIKFGLRLQGTGRFLEYLDMLTGNEFKQIEKYRHLRIHRREPRIELYGIAPHHDWPYMFPLIEIKEVELWRKKLAKQYPEDTGRNIIEKGCYINGVLFDRRQLKNRLWDYSDLKTLINNCYLSILKTTSGCFRSLSCKKPLRKK